MTQPTWVSPTIIHISHRRGHERQTELLQCTRKSHFTSLSNEQVHDAKRSNKRLQYSSTLHPPFILIQCFHQSVSRSICRSIHQSKLSAPLSIAVYIRCYNISSKHIYSFSAVTLLVGRREGHPACKKLGVGGDNLTGALHVLWLQLSPPPPSSLLQ